MLNLAELLEQGKIKFTKVDKGSISFEQQLFNEDGSVKETKTMNWTVAMLKGNIAQEEQMMKQFEPENIERMKQSAAKRKKMYEDLLKVADGSTEVELHLPAEGKKNESEGKEACCTKTCQTGECESGTCGDSTIDN